MKSFFSVVLLLLLVPQCSTGTGTGHVGYVGCSMTRGAAGGYVADGGTRLWDPAAMPIGSGTVIRWADERGSPTSKYWNAFKANLAKYPDTDTIWWELCERKVESDQVTQADALLVLDEIHSLTTATVYVSGLGNYVAPHVCSACHDKPIFLGTLARDLVQQGLVSQGPGMPDLSSIYQTPSDPAVDETVSDGCHGNEAGRLKLGTALLGFFG